PLDRDETLIPCHRGGLRPWCGRSPVTATRIRSTRRVHVGLNREIRSSRSRRRWHEPCCAGGWLAGGAFLMRSSKTSVWLLVLTVIATGGASGSSDGSASAGADLSSAPAGAGGGLPSATEDAIFAAARKVMTSLDTLQKQLFDADSKVQDQMDVGKITAEE